MRLHLVQLAEKAGHYLDPARLQGPAWNDASRESFHTADSRNLARVIEHGMGSPPAARLEQAVSSLSPDGRLVQAAFNEKVEREMGHLDAAGRSRVKADFARALSEKETREGPVVLSAELRRLATAPEPSPGKSAGPEPPRTEPDKPSKRRR